MWIIIRIPKLGWLTVPDVAVATQYLQLNGVDTCDEIEELPEDMHWITDPAGTVFNVQQKP